jgi:hypothetical protein
MPEAYTHIAMAYGRKGGPPPRDLASAPAAFMRGGLQTARQLASRANTRFPVGSHGWIKRIIPSPTGRRSGPAS